MKILALDVALCTGWAVLHNGALEKYGKFYTMINDFNAQVNLEVKSKTYPLNMINGAEDLASKVFQLAIDEKPDLIVIENTIKVRMVSQNIVKLLEWLHYAIIRRIQPLGIKIKYMAPSSWRSKLKLVLTDQDKIENKLSKQNGRKSRKINHKHLAIRYVNQRFNKSFDIKDDDITDAICLACAADSV